MLFLLVYLCFDLLVALLVLLWLLVLLRLLMLLRLGQLLLIDGVTGNGSGCALIGVLIVSAVFVAASVVTVVGVHEYGRTLLLLLRLLGGKHDVARMSGLRDFRSADEVLSRRRCVSVIVLVHLILSNCFTLWLIAHRIGTMVRLRVP